MFGGMGFVRLKASLGVAEDDVFCRWCKMFGGKNVGKAQCLNTGTRVVGMQGGRESKSDH